MRDKFEDWYLSSCLDVHEELPAWIAWKAALAQQTSAEKTLKMLGYTDCGGELWKPPLGTVEKSLLGSLAKNWTEDSGHENGNYTCKCGTCGCMFLGHKRRVTCKECAVVSKPAQVSQEPLLTLILGGVEGDEYGSNDIEWHHTAVDELQTKLVKYDSVYLPLYASPPDYEALQAENNLLKEVEKGFADLSENLQNDCAALKAENEELKNVLQFVERWANHHGVHPKISAQEALSCIQHYPRILDITESYKDGAIPTTRNHYAEIKQLRLRVAELESESRTKHEYAMQMLGERDRLQSECDRSNLRVLELETVARDSLNALIYHSDQTRPIERTEENIKAIRKTLWEN